MTRTGVCVPLEQYTGLEPARSAWKAEMLPLHQYCILPPGSPESGGPVFADCQDKCHDFCSRWRRMTESNRPPGRGNNPDRPSCAVLPVCPGCHALLTSALPPCSPYGGAGLSLQSGTKRKKVIHSRSPWSRVEGGIGFEPIASGCACRCTSACASRPYRSEWGPALLRPLFSCQAARD